VRLPADVALSAQGRAEQVDVWIDAAGQEIPYLIDTGAPRGTERELIRRVDATVLEARREQIERAGAAPLYRETYVLAAPPGDAPAWELVFAPTRRSSCAASVEAIDADGNRWSLPTRRCFSRQSAATKLRRAAVSAAPAPSP
jgi:hypothetical protein